MDILLELLIIIFVEGAALFLFAFGLYALYRLTMDLASRVDGKPDSLASRGVVQVVLGRFMDACRAAVGQGKRRWIVLGVLTFFAAMLTALALSRGVAMGVGGFDPGFFSDGTWLILDLEWGAVAAVILAIGLLGWLVLYCFVARRLSASMERAIQSRVPPLVLSALQILAIVAVAWLFVRPLRATGAIVYLAAPRSRRWLTGEGGVHPSLLVGFDELWTSPVLVITALWLAAISIASFRVLRGGSAVAIAGGARGVRVEQAVMLLLTIGLAWGLLEIT